MKTGDGSICILLRLEFRSDMPFGRSGKRFECGERAGRDTAHPFRQSGTRRGCRYPERRRHAHSDESAQQSRFAMHCRRQCDRGRRVHRRHAESCPSAPLFRIRRVQSGCAYRREARRRERSAQRTVIHQVKTAPPVDRTERVIEKRGDVSEVCNRIERIVQQSNSLRKKDFVAFCFVLRIRKHAEKDINNLLMRCR